LKVTEQNYHNFIKPRVPIDVEDIIISTGGSEALLFAMGSGSWR
jgi:hypothetical protein